MTKPNWKHVLYSGVPVRQCDALYETEEEDQLRHEWPEEDDQWWCDFWEALKKGVE